MIVTRSTDITAKVVKVINITMEMVIVVIVAGKTVTVVIDGNMTTVSYVAAGKRDGEAHLLPLQ